ncbi:hypothetical protein [Actinoplanes sichuanensis]|uniref:SMI1/KNR4 family protein n=1 Tax=Actinoplanes sichuanensis TaxID=512349 RepID=A0ABW4AUM5_9ACTN|nr:hypothetical protein [Actinoplanes sichuanensis]
MLTDDRPAGWAARLDDAVRQALTDVVSTFPFEADEHSVGPPTTAADLSELLSRMPWAPDGLVALQRSVGPVSLPDIGNGYFLYDVRGLTGVVDHDDGRPDRLAGPHQVDVVVFGGDGGGAQYAIALDDGRVLRLREAAYTGGEYDGPGITVIARDLPDFLEKLLGAVQAFGDGGRITDL